MFPPLFPADAHARDDDEDVRAAGQAGPRGPDVGGGAADGRHGRRTGGSRGSCNNIAQNRLIFLKFIPDIFKSNVGNFYIFVSPLGNPG